MPKDDGEIINDKDDKKLDRSAEKNEKTFERKIINVDRNQVYLEFKEREGKEYNDSIIHNAVMNKFNFILNIFIRVT